MRRIRWWMAAGALACLLAGCGAAGFPTSNRAAQLPSADQLPGQPAAPSTGSPTAGTSTSATTTSPAVDPGPLLQVTGGDLWEVPDPQAQPSTDGVTSGPDAGAQPVARPGTVLSRSTDGGRTWSPLYRSAAGIWGFDAISPMQAVVVGVDAVAGTTDGGAQWQSLAEPAGATLVRVVLATAAIGYGVSADGRFWRTADGGRSWTLIPEGVAVGAICVTGPTLYLAFLPSGLASGSASTGGLHPVQGQALAGGGVQGWVGLRCNGATVAALTYPAAGGPARVAVSADGGARFTTVATGAVAGLVAGPQQISVVTTDAGGGLAWRTYSTAGRATSATSEVVYQPKAQAMADLVGVVDQPAGDLAAVDVVAPAGPGTSVVPLLQSAAGGARWTTVATAATFTEG